MEQTRNFRGAFNGFNREDVVRYLEYLNNKHTNTCNQLNGELTLLRQKLENQNTGELQKQCADLKAELDAAQLRQTELTERIAQLEAQAAELTARNAELEAAVKAADAEKAALQSRCDALESQTAKELEAYRRAERAERVARERADRIYGHTNGILADATATVDTAAREMDTVSEKLLQNMGILREAVEKSRAAMREAAQTMYQLRPEEKEEVCC